MPQTSAQKLQFAPPHSETQSNMQGTTRARRNAAVIGEMLRRDKVQYSVFVHYNLLFVFLQSCKYGLDENQNGGVYFIV